MSHAERSLAPARINVRLREDRRAPVLKAVFEDPELELSAVQRRQLPEVVRSHLATLEGRRPAEIVGLVREG